MTLLGPRAEGTVGWLVGLAMAVPVLLILVWVFEMLWLGLSFRLAGVLGVFACMSLLLCLPALAGLRHPNGWWAPLLTGLAALLFTGIGLLSARPTPDRPAPRVVTSASVPMPPAPTTSTGELQSTGAGVGGRSTPATRSRAVAGTGYEPPIAMFGRRSRHLAAARDRPTLLARAFCDLGRRATAPEGRRFLLAMG